VPPRLKSRPISQPSHWSYGGRLELNGQLHDWAATVTTVGGCVRRRTINSSQVFADGRVGVRQVDEHLRLVTFMHDEWGCFE
jgi:putative transposase